MMLPDTNAGQLSSRLYDTRFALFFTPRYLSRARIQPGRVEDCGER